MTNTQENINRLTDQVEENTVNYRNAVGLVEKEYYSNKLSVLRMKLEKAIRRQ